MKSTKGITIPVIDVAGLYSDDPDKRYDAAFQIGKAVDYLGFFYAKNHQVPEAVCKGVYEAAEDFFSMDMAKKMKYYIGLSHSHKGYVPPNEVGIHFNNNYEAFDMGVELDDCHPDVQRNLPFYGHNRWPSELPTFKSRLVAYHKAVHDLALRLLQAFALTLGLDEKDLDQYFSEPMEPMRLISYPATDKRDTELPINPHEDPEAITILMSNKPGLELDIGDDEWLDAPPLPGTFIVNIGQVLQVMSNGRIKAKRHRVHKVSEARISIPFFLSPMYSVPMLPLPQFAQKGPYDNYFNGMSSGDVLWAAIMQAYRYTVEKINRGEAELPLNAKVYRTQWNTQ